MTAIAGFWRFDGKSDADDALGRMLRAQEIYGPHQSSRWTDGPIALGRRLFRILPEDRYDSQPLTGQAGRSVLVADIRLDNRAELERELAIQKERASTTSDAGILLAALERWGEASLDRIIGDYAFAFWDAPTRRLLLARDPLGQRPLHYYRGSGFLAFASMPKGLHAVPEIPYALDEDRIVATLALLPEWGSGTFFRGIERVEPGHVATVTEHSFSVRRHWHPSRKKLGLKTPAEYAEALRFELDRAVRCRLRGTGDVGAYLSGGLDSGAVAATAARLLAPSGRRLIAFTSVPREGYCGPAPSGRLIDEGDLAAKTAALYPNIEHVIVPNIGCSPLAGLDRSFHVSDGPAGQPSWSGWSYSLDMAMKGRDLPVTLGGEFGNLGLSYDGMALLPELLQSGRWGHLLHEWRALTSSGRMSWRGALAHSFGPWMPSALWVWLHKATGRDVPELETYSAVNRERLKELGVGAQKHDFVYRPAKDSFAHRLAILQQSDAGTGYLGSLGGWQTDHRDPTSDIRLLEFCLSVPTDQFLRDGVPRALALNALSDRLPKEVLEERRRGLQAADWHEDLSRAKGDIEEELDRIEGCHPAARAIDVPRLRGLLANWPTDGWDHDEIVLSYRYALLRAIAMGHFVRRASRSNQ